MTVHTKQVLRNLNGTHGIEILEDNFGHQTILVPFNGTDYVYMTQLGMYYDNYLVNDGWDAIEVDTKTTKKIDNHILKLAGII